MSLSFNQPAAQTEEEEKGTRGSIERDSKHFIFFHVKEGKL